MRTQATYWKGTGMDATTLRQEALTETYADVNNLIYHTVWNFQKKYGGEFGSLLAEANLLFLLAYDSYNEVEASFSTWLCFKIRKGLLDYIKAEYNQLHGISFFDEEGEDISDQLLPWKKSSSFHLSEILEIVSQDTKDLIKIIIYPPERVTTEELEKGFGVRSSRKYLKAYLADKLGWTAKRIKESFAEVRVILSD